MQLINTQAVSAANDRLAHASHRLMQDIEFIDIIEYDPQQMAAPPYRLRISTKLPSAGDRVRLPGFSAPCTSQPCLRVHLVC